MSKQQYRSEMGILGDILSTTIDGGRNGVLVSTISRQANLSHYATLKKCDKLIGAGMLKPIRMGRNRLFVISEQGIAFLKEFKRFQELVTSMNLKC